MLNPSDIPRRIRHPPTHPTSPDAPDIPPTHPTSPDTPDTHHPIYATHHPISRSAAIATRYTPRGKWVTSIGYAPKSYLMPYNPKIHHRRSIRLPGYDYTQEGAYFVTICTHQRQCLFGEIVDGQMHLNLCGQVVVSRWQNIPRHFPRVQLDEFVLMPDHLHGIIVIGEGEGIAFPDGGSIGSRVFAGNAMPLRGTETDSLGAIVQNFKSVTTRKINQINRSAGTPVWQRNYHERIIRDEMALHNIRRYIAANPLKWEGDREGPFIQPKASDQRQP